MKNYMLYKLVMYGSVGSTMWEFPFTQLNDRLALTYAQKLCANDPAARTCDKLVLFNMTNKKTIVEFGHCAPTVKTKVLEPIEGLEL